MGVYFVGGSTVAGCEVFLEMSPRRCLVFLPRVYALLNVGYDAAYIDLWRTLVLTRAIVRSMTTRCPQSGAPSKWRRQWTLWLGLIFAFVCLRPNVARAQCAGIASTPAAAADCAAHAISLDTVATLDLTHPYTLAELIDIAEHNNPRTRIVWEQAKQKAGQLGIEKSAYYPVLAGLAVFADE